MKYIGYTTFVIIIVTIPVWTSWYFFPKFCLHIYRYDVETQIYNTEDAQDVREMLRAQLFSVSYLFLEKGIY